MRLVAVVEVMLAPVHRVWEVVSDIELYPRLMGMFDQCKSWTEA